MENKEWVLLFCVNDRAWLQDELNRAVRDYDVTDIKVWADIYSWKGIVRYRGKSPQILVKPTSSEECPVVSDSQE